MKEPLISVIVPVYNSEKYLDQCNTSIVNQSYNNLEIIYVDDGSSDNSGVILDEFAKKDDRITVIHKENGGVSSARNKALDIMKGEYVTFIDSDDYVDKDYILSLYNNLIKTDADISICIFEEVDEKGNHISYERSGEAITVNVDDNYDLFSYYAGKRTCVMLIKTSLFKVEPPIRYDASLIIGEDKLVFNQLLVRCKKISYSPDALYKYVRHSESAMRSGFNEKKYSVIEAHKKIAEVYKNSGYKKLYLKSKEMLAFQCYDLLCKLKENKVKNNKIRKKLKREMRKHICIIWKTVDGIGLRIKYTVLSFIG